MFLSYTMSTRTVNQWWVWAMIKSVLEARCKTCCYGGYVLCREYVDEMWEVYLSVNLHTHTHMHSHRSIHFTHAHTHTHAHRCSRLISPLPCNRKWRCWGVKTVAIWLRSGSESLVSIERSGKSSSRGALPRLVRPPNESHCKDISAGLELLELCVKVKSTCSIWRSGGKSFVWEKWGPGDGWP